MLNVGAAGGSGKEEAQCREYLADYGWLAWILIGLHRRRHRQGDHAGPRPGGCLVTIVLGIAGALLAGFLGQQLGWYEPGEGAGFLAAIVGAVLILLVYRLVASR